MIIGRDNTHATPLSCYMTQLNANRLMLQMCFQMEDLGAAFVAMHH